MKFLKIFSFLIIFLLVISIASGCSWRRSETDSTGDSANLPAAEVEVTADSPVVFENFKELDVSSDGLVASNYDGQLAWSPDGTLVAVGMSNQTLASTQTQLLEVATGRRVAVIGGYNVHWDQANPDRLIFIRHQYYGPPDYGSFEETLAISQAELLQSEVFNEDMSYEVIAEGEIETGSLPEDVLQAVGWGSSEIQVKVENGQVNIYYVGVGREMIAPLDPGKHYNGLAITSDGKKILIREVAGEADEFGNLEANDNNTRFLIANIIEK